METISFDKCIDFIGHEDDWPNCCVPDCEYKANIQLGKGMCFAHSRGYNPIPFAEYELIEGTD